MKNVFKDKSVLFITTKNLDYIRNHQEIEMIRQEAARLTIWGSAKKSYLKRLLYVYMKCCFSKTKKYDIIFIGFAPQLILPLWSWKFKKATVIIDFFISVYDTMVFDRQKFKVNGCAAKFCHFIDQRTLKKADSIICDTNCHGEYFSSEFGIDRSKITTLYLEADTNIYFPREQKHIHSDYTVLYFGSILPLQGLDTILGAVDLLKDEPGLSFVIVGPIPDLSKAPKADNIHYYSWLSQTELAEKIAEADLCLAGHFNSHIEKAKRTIPGKAYIYHSMKKPMILGDNPANRELFNENMEGIYFVEMGSRQKLAQKILECRDQR